MNEKSKTRYLKKIVLYCLMFISAVVLGGLFVCWRVDADPTGVVQAAIAFFGVELLLMCLIKLLGDKKEDKTNG